MHVVSIILASVVVGVAVVEAQQCNVMDWFKQDCHQNSQQACSNAGCCWHPVQPNPSNLPWCYRQATPFALHPAYSGLPLPFASHIDQLRFNMLANIDIGGKGGVLASPDTMVNGGGSYYYAWMRDGGLSMRTFFRVWPNATNADRLFVLAKMQSYVNWVVRAQNQNDPHGIDVRTEPKFNLPNGDVDQSPWCRPQTDGPAIRGTTLALFGQQLLANGDLSYVQQFLWTGNSGNLNGGLVAYDLDWVAANWNSAGCDLWEEISSSSFFWNLIHFRLSMAVGSEFAQAMGDSSRASKYASEVKLIDAAIMQHWNGQFFYETLSSGRQVDSAVIGALKFAFQLRHHGLSFPFPFDATSNYVAQTAQVFANAFFNTFAINQKINTLPGLFIGRYLGDTYGGGNPWILSTAQYATLLYEVAWQLRKSNSVPSASLATWNSFLDSSLQAQNATGLAKSLIAVGDGIMQRLEAFTKSYNYQLSEQLDKNSGAELSATNLTWSYAEVLDAVATRAQL